MIVALNVVGARPNFMKLAPVHRAMRSSGRIEPVVLHTGQHYDDNMSDVFLRELGLPRPDVELGTGSGTHARQTADVMVGTETAIADVRPDAVVVYGDVNSTVAAALTAVKMGIPVAHVESGLRSFDRSMPEEINRVVTDAISDLLFAPSGDAVANLAAEGVDEQRVFLVGNVMIDTLLACLPAAERSTIREGLGLEPGSYVLATLHRPSNVDDHESLKTSVEALIQSSALAPTVLVVHPRTQARLAECGLRASLDGAGVRVIEPLGYVDFVALLRDAGAVLTDSGGIQEETTVLGIGCVTMRTTTERPITVTEGTNRLVGTDPSAASEAVAACLREPRRPTRPPLWDGHAAERIVRVLLEL